MKPVIWIIYDCPLQKCNKSWIHEGLQKIGYEVKIKDICFEISHIEQRGLLGKIFARLITLLQCIEVLVNSKPNEVVFCWSNFSGLYFNALPGAKKRKIISYNWLTPTPRKRTLFLYHNALANPNLRAIINCEDNKTKLLESYQVEDINNIFFIPDVYDDLEEFRMPHYVEDKEQRYCFMGGRANRDWDLFFKIAESNPYINFIGIAVSADWDSNREIPLNVKMYFDVTAARYYELLEKAYLAIYPLKDERVAGLVNVVKSIQKGVLVLVSDIPATRMYYEKRYHTLLQSIGDLNDWNKKIQMFYNYSKDEYFQTVINMQNYLKQNFSPEQAVVTIDKMVQSFQK